MCTDLWQEGVEVKLQKTHHVRTTFAGWILHLVRMNQACLCMCSASLQKQWHAWGMWRGFAQRYFVWRPLCKRHLHRTCQEIKCCFAEKCCVLEHQIFRFAKTFLPNWCALLMALASLFPGMRDTLNGWRGKTQNSLARHLPESLCFWCCQIREWTKPP